VRKAETPADDAAIAKEAADVLRAGARGYVEVLGFSAQEKVTHATANEVGLETGAVETPDDLGRVGVDAIFVEDDVVAYEAGSGVELLRRLAAIRPAACLQRGRARDFPDRKRGEIGRSWKIVVGRKHGLARLWPRDRGALYCTLTRWAWRLQG
jgi:hypothetical protein